MDAVAVAADPVAQPPGRTYGFHGVRAPTVARWSTVEGTGLTETGVNESASFTIVAHDFTGARQQTGGDTFFVAVRCNAQGTRVRAKIADLGDGSYCTTFKPPTPGKYTIALSLLGEPLPGSPFACTVSTPTPKADKCILNGDALTRATARKVRVQALARKMRDSCRSL